MKSITIRLGVVLCILCMAAGQAEAQRRPGTQPSPDPQFNQPVPTATFGNLPVRTDTGMVNETAQPSVRPTHFYDRGNASAVNPLEYEHVRWDDALYLQKVWREIDIREKLNQSFRYDATEDNGSQLFVNILLRAVQKEGVAAFADDRFTIPVSQAEIRDMTLGRLDTFMKMKPGSVDVPDSLIVTRESFDPKVVTRFRIMEEWFFDREGSRLYSRILGIAALKRHSFPLGGGKEREGYSVLFWVYFPDLRPILANTAVYSPKNMGIGRMTWDELFQSRMFSSYITKSTMSNVSNKNIREYIKDPKLALLEGEEVQAKIHSYEQDQWSY